MASVDRFPELLQIQDYDDAVFYLNNLLAFKITRGADHGFLGRAGNRCQVFAAQAYENQRGIEKQLSAISTTWLFMCSLNCIRNNLRTTDPVNNRIRKLTYPYIPQ